MLDFTKANKKFLNIKMIDGKTILVKMPTKKVFDLLLSIEENLKTLTTDNKQQVEELFDLAAEVLSNNLKNEKIESEYLSSINFDVEDVTIFLNSYESFMIGGIDDPNSKSPQSKGTQEGRTNTTDAIQTGND